MHQRKILLQYWIKKPLSELSQKDKNLNEAERENFTDPQLNHTQSHGSDEEPLSETSAESEADYLKPRETNPVTSPTPGNQISDAENALKISATPYYPAHHTKKIFDTSVFSLGQFSESRRPKGDVPKTILALYEEKGLDVKFHMEVKPRQNSSATRIDHKEAINSELNKNRRYPDSELYTKTSEELVADMQNGSAYQQNLTTNPELEQSNGRGRNTTANDGTGGTSASTTTGVQAHKAAETQSNTNQGEKNTKNLNTRQTIEPEAEPTKLYI